MWFDWVISFLQSSETYLEYVNHIIQSVGLFFWKKMKSINQPYSPQYTESAFEIKDNVTDEGIFRGLGTVFDDKPDDSFMRDIIKPGAFQKTIKQGGRNGNGIVMLSQHGRFDLNPIGIWSTLIETSKGLELNGELITDGSRHAVNSKGTQLANETHVLMRAKALRGLSIGFDFPRNRSGKIKDGVIEFDREKDIRIIKEVVLWEVSPVTFPAKKNATIGNVKSIFEAQTERELEASLKNYGFSGKEAGHMVRLCKTNLLRESKGLDISSMEIILGNLKNLNRDMKGLANG